MARNHSPRIPDHSDSITEIASHHGAGADDGPIADFDPWQDHRPGPNLTTDTDRDVSTEGGIWRDMREVGDHVVMIDTGGGVDDNMFANPSPCLQDGAMVDDRPIVDLAGRRNQATGVRQSLKPSGGQLLGDSSADGIIPDGNDQRLARDQKPPMAKQR